MKNALIKWPVLLYTSTSTNVSHIALRVAVSLTWFSHLLTVRVIGGGFRRLCSSLLNKEGPSPRLDIHKTCTVYTRTSSVTKSHLQDNLYFIFPLNRVSPVLTNTPGAMSSQRSLAHGPSFYESKSSRRTAQTLCKDAGMIVMDKRCGRARRARLLSSRYSVAPHYPRAPYGQQRDA